MRSTDSLPASISINTVVCIKIKCQINTTMLCVTDCWGGGGGGGFVAMAMWPHPGSHAKDKEQESEWMVGPDKGEP